MPKAVNKRGYLVIILVIGLVSLVSCGPVPVPGLFLEFDGRSLPVLAPKSDNPASLRADGLRVGRYSPAEPLKIREFSDLVLLMEVKGSIRVGLYARDKDETPILEASFVGLGEPLLAFHVSLPQDAIVAAVQIELDSADAAVVKGFAIAEPYLGYKAADGEGVPAVISQGVHRVFSPEAGFQPQEIYLPKADGPGWSVVLSQRNRGSLRVAGAEASFDMAPAPGKPIALPLSFLGGQSVGIRALGTTGLAEAQLVYGGEAPFSDLHAILAASGRSGAGEGQADEYALYRWDILPDTLVFDFSSYAVQDSYLKRLAFYAEKPGFRGRLAPDGEIAHLHGWNAHDYPALTLASFFGLAHETGFKLNQSERALLDLLLDYGIVVKDDTGGLQPGRGAIISISRESTPVYRRVFMDHEASHALFFQDLDYRRLAEDLWNSHDAASRRFWTRHLRWRNYDTGDSYLAVNELQAYLVQQSASGAVSYIRDNVLVRLATAYPAAAEELAADSSAILSAVANDVAALNAYLRDRWDLAAGRFGRVRRAD